MKETEHITCPKCGHIQEQDIYDMTDTSDMSGEFDVECEACEAKFKVEFEFKSFIKCEEI